MPGVISPSAPPPLTSVSGTAIRKAPMRQLSKIQLSCTRASFMPAYTIPAPSGTETRMSIGASSR